MSCIIAQRYKDHFIFIADSQSSSDIYKFHIADEYNGKSCRILSCPNALIAHTGSAKDISIVRQIDHLFDNFDKYHPEFNYRYVVGKMIPMIHQEYVDLGVYQNEEAINVPSEFFVAKDDKAFHITRNGGVVEITDFACEGSGSYAGAGAYFACQNEPDPIIRCLKAVRAAIKFDNCCGYPILIHSSKPGVFYSLNEEEVNEIINKERTINL